jgi:chitinase
VITVAAVLLGNRGLVIASRNASLPTYTALDFDPLAAKLPTASIQAAASQTPSADFLAALAKGKLPISNKTTIASANAFESSRNRCPATCSEAGIAPTNWTVYHDANRLSACNETMLLDFAVYNPLNDPETQVRIRACTADANTDVQSLSQSTTAASCISHNSTAPLQATLQLGSLAGSGLGSTAEVLDATQNLAKRLIYVPKSCDSTVNFAYSGQSVVAVYAGAEIQSQGIATTVLQQFIKHLQTSPVSGNTFLQLCGTSDRGSDYAMGIMASTNASLALAQSAVKMWHDGKCLTSDDATTPWSNVTILAPTPSSQGNSTSHTTPVSRAIRPRATCSTIQVVSGDGCASLASKCGITAAQFTTYNPSSTLCSTLSVGESVCCSAGTLPDFSPQPNPDGSCATYLVVSGDYCSAIAASHSITIAEIEQFNNETWGWTGCDNLQVGVNMCLSTGKWLVIS